MPEGQTSIGAWLFWSVLVMVNISYGFINATTYQCATMGANSYLLVLLAALASFPGLAAIYLLMKRFPGQNLIQQGIVILGGFCGRVMGFVYLVFLICLFTAYNRDVSNMIHVYVLQSTPYAVICLISLIPTIYLGTRGIETIARLASFVVLPLLVVIMLLTVWLLPEISFTRLLPVFKFTFDFSGVGGLTILNIFYPLGVFALITPYLKGIQKKVPKMTILAFGVVIISSLLFNIGTIGIFGHEYLQRFVYPTVEVLRILEQPYLLMEQAGLFIIITMFSNVVIGSGFFTYSMGLCAEQVFVKWNYKRFVWIIALLIFFLELRVYNVAETKALALLVARYGWLVIWGYPLLLYGLALIFKKSGVASDVA